MPLNSAAEQRVRLTNRSDDNLWLTALEITDSMQFDVRIDHQAFTLEPEQTPQLLPVPFQAGESIYIEISLQSGEQTGQFETEALLLELDAGNELEPETVVIPLHAEIRECAAGTMSCDGRAETGCEINIDEDIDNCGACGNSCVLDNADATCAESQCVSEIGAGGTGGHGGHGGGGAGGPSIPIMIRTTDLPTVATDNDLLAGQGGTGGFSSGNNGAAGLSQDIRAF